MVSYMDVKQACDDILAAKLALIEAQELERQTLRDTLEYFMKSGLTEFFSLNMNAVYRNADQDLAWKLRDRMPHRSKPLPVDRDKPLKVKKEYVDRY